jgi:trimeric autotransporter adhesin
MKTRTIILSAVLAAIGSASFAEEVVREPGIPMPKPTPGVPSDPAPITSLKPAIAHADRGDARSLQQAQAYADQGDARTLNAAQQHTAAQVAGLQRDTAAGIAQAAALVPLDPSADGETTVNVGAATYAGQTALGLSLSHRTGRMTFSAGAGTSGSSRTLVRVGLGWRF